MVIPGLGGNGAVAWQLTPSHVAYVGYSGSEPAGPVLAALYRLAAHSRPMDVRQWHATHPQTVTVFNDRN